MSVTELQTSVSLFQTLTACSYVTYFTLKQGVCAGEMSDGHVWLPEGMTWKWYTWSKTAVAGQCINQALFSSFSSRERKQHAGDWWTCFDLWFSFKKSISEAN